MLRGGVKVEEAVMVYALRSVELVLAVMVILKVSTTLSAIGPSFVLHIN